ncbi:MAG: M56 family metallopeptidase [Bacteroidales bacterium]|nr:M56 family metallopeptidase [Bacteroidales bacterium]
MFKLVDLGIIVLSSGFLLLCYMLFLHKEKYHQLNRFYLLFSLAFSSLLPFIKFSVPVQPLMPNTQSFLTTVTEAPAIPFGMVLYVAGAALFFILFLLRLFKVLKQIIGKHFIELNGLKVMDNPEQKVPFSFFHYVVVDSTTFELDELDLVLRHEAAHAQQWHTLDILFVELVGVICWFNPFVWAYKSALKSQHEYAADASVIHSNVPRNDYFDLILKQIRHQNRLAPVHSFSATAVKSRIRMMMATVHGRHRWMRYLSVIPVLVLLVVGNSLLASSKNIPSFMENVVVPAAVSQSLSENSDKTETVPMENIKAKRAVRQAKSQQKREENISQLEALESQSWLSTQYGDPVEFYDKVPDAKQEEHYNVVVTGDVPQIYQVSVSETP